MSKGAELILILFTLCALLMFSSAAISEDAVYYVICKPGSEVNVRARPELHSPIAGTKYFGDAVIVDREKNGFAHVTNLFSEYSDGWIYKGLLTEDKPVEVYQEAQIMADGIVFGRKYCGGKVIHKLKDGTGVMVYAVGEEWCVTNYGYIKTEFLTINPQVSEPTDFD